MKIFWGVIVLVAIEHIAPHILWKNTYEWVIVTLTWSHSRQTRKGCRAEMSYQLYRSQLFLSGRDAEMHQTWYQEWMKRYRKEGTTTAEQNDLMFVQNKIRCWHERCDLQNGLEKCMCLRSSVASTYTCTIRGRTEYKPVGSKLRSVNECCVQLAGDTVSFVCNPDL